MAKDITVRGVCLKLEPRQRGAIVITAINGVVPTFSPVRRVMIGKKKIFIESLSGIKQVLDLPLLDHARDVYAADAGYILDQGDHLVQSHLHQLFIDGQCKEQSDIWDAAFGKVAVYRGDSIIVYTGETVTREIPLSATVQECSFIYQCKHAILLFGHTILYRIENDDPTPTPIRWTAHLMDHRRNKLVIQTIDQQTAKLELYCIDCDSMQEMGQRGQFKYSATLRAVVYPHVLIVMNYTHHAYNFETGQWIELDIPGMVHRIVDDYLVLVYGVWDWSYMYWPTGKVIKAVQATTAILIDNMFIWLDLNGEIQIERYNPLTAFVNAPLTPASGQRAAQSTNIGEYIGSMAMWNETNEYEFEME